MARKQIDIGTIGNDGTGDSIRDSFRKVNDNFRELYSSLGLGERLKFIGLDDTPDSYVGQNDPTTGSTPVVTVNNTESGLAFKQLVPGNGISIDFSTNPNEITINAEFAAISADPTPKLGGDLSLRSGGDQFRVVDSGTTNDPLQPIFRHELVNKAYADSKISRAGTNAINPESGNVDASFGRMSGPLVLSRDPEPEDDETFGGLIAATKRYVDNASFGSVANLYVATSGADDRPGVSKALQGRALAYAYRSLEAACKRAEELVLEAPLQIGPYKKVLTYNNGANECILESIDPSPASGSGFIGSLRMSVDAITLNSVGTNYYPGDILSLQGGTGLGSCTIEILSTQTTPGAILTFRIISTGSYTTLPGSTGVPTTVVTSAAPIGIGSIGNGARFNVTYKLNSVSIINGGTGYTLVSVRIAGGGGTGAFGTAIAEAGVITGITITDRGSGFTSLPVLNVDLPRFLIKTEGYRTDFTGDVSTTTPESVRGRDIREGLFLRGETSGALAQIVSHAGALDSEGREIFDVDIKSGTFQLGEVIAYGDISKNIQICILVESGEYYEHYPLKVPDNCSIVGDEFRRVIFRPKPGTSSSPWAFQKFRRDLVMDGISITDATTPFAYHYLQDPSQPVYPKIQNKGDYRAAATLLELNRSFLQEEIIAWMNFMIANTVAPFGALFQYNEALCKRDVGLLADAFIFDLKYGEYNRTISAGLKYYESASGEVAITTQLSQYIAVIAHLETLMQAVIDNTPIGSPKQSLFPQIIDPAYSSEPGADVVITALLAALKDVIDGSGSVNYPKENQEMDVFLANDAIRWQAISCIGHGGFMGVLDPAGQILSRSPYFQECASFSRSKDRQVFAGGMFTDGFAGNLEFTIETVVTPTRLEVGSLDRFPLLPCSFIVGDSVYRINYVRDFIYDKDGSSATFILDETTPWPFEVFTYNSAACFRDTGLILDGLSYDILFGTNFWTRQNGLTYRLSQSAVVINDQRAITLEAIGYAHQLVKNKISGYPTIQSVVDLSNSTIADIVERGDAAAPVLTFTLPPGVSTNVSNAYTLLMANRNYIVAEVSGWIKAQIAGNISPWASSDVYAESRSQRDLRTAIEAVIHDLIYGGNAATRLAALKYYNNLTGLFLLPAGQSTRWPSALAYASTIIGRIVQNLAPAVTYSSLVRVTGSAASAAEATIIANLITGIRNSVSAANFVNAQAAVPLSTPGTVGYSANNLAVRNIIQSVKTEVQTSVVEYVDFNGNRYELLMPGNRSMLANDFTQINDMGYGAVTINGGLTELVSMFTYYCYIAYYSVTGGQIRSVSGSNAHGVYALVAEGADPLEVPTPTGLYEDLSQAVTCYFPTPSYANVVGGLAIFVTNYDYPPMGGAELEINHSGVIYRYPVSSAATSGNPPGVSRLNLSTGSGGTSDGLVAVVADGTIMTLRCNGQILLTGALENVAVRPSTGLKLRETEDVVYRVLQFSADVDENGPYEILVNLATPTIFKVLATVTTIASNVCTTSKNHKLRLGDQFIPTSTANGFISGTIYYITELTAYNKFKVSTSPGGASPTLTNGTGLTIKGVKTHKLQESYTIDFFSTGSLPAPLNGDFTYFVLANNLTETEFSISGIKGGTEIELTSVGTGTSSYNIAGLTLTNLRENYNYVDLTVNEPGEYVSGSQAPCTINIASPATITRNSHGFVAGDVIRFSTAGTLPTGITALNRYFVLSAGLALNSFRVSLQPGGTAVDTTGTQAGIHTVGKVTGRVGDTSFAVVSLGTQEVSRIPGSKFMFLGQEYIISTYESEAVTLQPYARITINRPLVDAVNQFGSSYTVKASVPTRTSGSLGTLTIRIALVRVTGHDLLEIGTGSYADTNYPKEIYGPSVNALNEEGEVIERDVGRCFYVTTDQFGNFKVGPYFKVDQGTGTVTFSASIALSNLDGIGFKRGVPVAEFSTDSAFTDNAVDTVPTENATRKYIERRLGISHDGSLVPPSEIIPLVSGGFMSLDGQLAMKASIDMDQNKLINVGNPTNPQDAVNLRSLTWSNFQNFSSGNIDAADVLVFTGSGDNAVAANVIGDVTFELRPGVDSTLNQVNVQLVPGIVVNSDINNKAHIIQSKLALQPAGTSPNQNSTSVGFDFTTGVTTGGFNGFVRYIIEATAIVAGNRYLIVNTSQPTGASTNYVTQFGAPDNNENTIFTSTANGNAGSGRGQVINLDAMQSIGGLATFNEAQFTSNFGWISLKTNGTSLTTLPQIGTKTVLGNSTLGTANVTAVAFTTVVDDGGAIKKTQYAGPGFLRRTSAISSTSDADYAVIAGSAGSSGTVGASELIVRDINGDFGGRTADLQSIKIDTQLAIDTSTISTGGFIRYYGYNSAGGVLIQDGSLAADKKTGYWNDLHEFKTQNGVSNAPITCSTITGTSIQVTAITTGGNTTAGTITGRWTLTGTSPNESRLQATYSADLAEYYEGDKEYEVGTVLVFGGDKEVTLTNVQGDSRVAGVVSNTAAFAMYEGCPGLKNLVALQGRVPCKVVGKIRKGEMLVTSRIPGVAVAAGADVKVGTVVGKALVDYDSDHIGTIEIAVGRT